MAILKVKKGKEPEKKKPISLHAIRKPGQRTLPWVMQNGNEPGPSTPMIISTEDEEMMDGTYFQHVMNGIYPAMQCSDP